MAHQIKRLMADKSMDKLSGVVQIDEGYFGMKLANKHRRARAESKENSNWNDNKTGVMSFINDKKEIKFEVMTDLSTFKQKNKKAR
jgi:hypothetical protein